MSALACSLALVLLAAPLAALAAEGQVVQASARRAWLDAGRLDGLAEDQVLDLRRGNAKLTCKVEWVFERRATCLGSGLRMGDRFARAVAPAVHERPAALRAPSNAQAQASVALEALKAAPQALLEFHGVQVRRGLPGELARGEASFGHASWLSTDAGPWHQERLDARLRGYRLADGIFAWVDLTALSWTRRSGSVYDQPDSSTQLHVWEAQVTARSPDRAWTASLGRLSAWMAPGATRIDGAQVGLRSAEGNELGFFGGGLPDQTSLSPDFGSATFGLYWNVRRQTPSLLPFVQQQGRIALVSTPALGQRVEAEGTLLASLLGKLDLGLELRGGAGGLLASGLDALRVDVTGKPTDSLSLAAGFRWIGVDRPEYASMGSPAGGRSSSADLSGAYTLGWMTVGLGSGYVHDAVTGLWRGWAGPDLSAPRFLSERVSIALGYREELGWLSGRTLWLQTLARPVDPVSLLLRVSWSQQARPDTGNDQDVGLFLRASAVLADVWQVRLEGLGRVSPVASNSAAMGSHVDVAIARTF